MNLSNLIASREKLVAQARLANMAFAYATLKRLAAVVARGHLSGVVRLQEPNEKEEHYWATLTAVSGSQAVLDEHFSDDDVAALVDAVAVATPGNLLDVTISIEDLEHDYVVPLEVALRRAGVKLEGPQVHADQQAE